jgi:hypothetical protein
MRRLDVTDADFDAKDERQIWLGLSSNRLKTLRGPGESYSDVILRLAKG